MVSFINIESVLIEAISAIWRYRIEISRKVKSFSNFGLQ